MTSSGNSLLNNNGRRIDASLLSVEHTFQAQNADKGGTARHAYRERIDRAEVPRHR